jgi:hypothetical protein
MFYLFLTANLFLFICVFFFIVRRHASGFPVSVLVVLPGFVRSLACFQASINHYWKIDHHRLFPSDQEKVRNSNCCCVFKDNYKVLLSRG